MTSWVVVVLRFASAGFISGYVDALTVSGAYPLSNLLPDEASAPFVIPEVHELEQLMASSPFMFRLVLGNVGPRAQ